jgi:hypothetical protein
MPYYNLQVVASHEILSDAARDRADALSKFSEELGVQLTLDDSGGPAEYLLDEWDGPGPHWIRPHIRVFRIAN